MRRLLIFLLIFSLLIIGGFSFLIINQKTNLIQRKAHSLDRVSEVPQDDDETIDIEDSVNEISNEDKISESSGDSSKSSSSSSSSSCKNKKTSYALKNIKKEFPCLEYSNMICIKRLLNCSIDVYNLDSSKTGTFGIKFSYFREDNKQQIKEIIKTSDIPPLDYKKILSIEIIQSQTEEGDANSELDCIVTTTLTPTTGC